MAGSTSRPREQAVDDAQIDLERVFMRLHSLGLTKRANYENEDEDESEEDIYFSAVFFPLNYWHSLCNACHSQPPNARLSTEIPKKEHRCFVTY